MTLSDMARSDLLWWTENITTSCNTATHGTPQVTIHSDAFLTGSEEFLIPYQLGVSGLRINLNII